MTKLGMLIEGSVMQQEAEEEARIAQLKAEKRRLQKAQIVMGQAIRRENLRLAERQRDKINSLRDKIHNLMR
ncbi:MAG: hypothetical protein ACXADY_26305 [Candidatus Hodarchaeales archaeon]|jgi:hypothetical protein